MKHIALYMAGSIQKGHETGNELFWTEEHLAELEAYLQPAHVAFLNPAYRMDDLSDELSVFGRDMMQVFSADAVVVDARAKRGLGVGAEMMWAKMQQIPVIAWAPKESHYHKSKTSVLGVEVEEFIHPFVYSLSDYIAETLADIAQYLKHPKGSVKGVEFIHLAMQHFIKNNLQRDLPMLEIFARNPYVKERADALL